MAFETGSYSPPGDGVVWDLRQFYVEWVKEYMSGFSRVHVVDNYPLMFSTLRRWHTAIYGRSITEYKVDGTKDKIFEELMGKIISLSNKKENTNTYLLREKSAIAVADFDMAFNSTVVYLVWLMKKHKLFGSDSVNRGLM